LEEDDPCVIDKIHSIRERSLANATYNDFNKILADAHGPLIMLNYTCGQKASERERESE
jgi:hypothetical protein